MNIGDTTHADSGLLQTVSLKKSGVAGVQELQNETEAFRST
jgi:hypothetical protein